MNRPAALSTAIVVMAGVVGVGAGALVGVLGDGGGAAAKDATGRPNNSGTSASSTPSGPSQDGGSNSSSFAPTNTTSDTDSTTTSGTTSAANTGGTTSPSAPATGEPLYYVDGVIHDGSTQVSYQPTFQSQVSALDRTEAGWVVLERSGQDSSQLMLVDVDGGVTPIELEDPHSFDVSPAGDAVAVPYGGEGAVEFVDPKDGSTISTLQTSVAAVIHVRFAGDELLFDGTGAGGAVSMWRYDISADRIASLDIKVPGKYASLEDASVDGRYAVAGYVTGNTSCVAVFQLDGSKSPLWKSCDNAPLGGSTLSPDGQRLVLTPSGKGGQSISGLTVAETATGAEIGTLPVDRSLEAAWADDSHVLVEAATSDAYTSFTLSLCTATGSCAGLPDANAAHPADDVAAGRGA